VKPESEDYLDQAREDLDDAKKVIGIPLPKIAARCAYYAAFHAAEAFIYERTDRVAKTHSGVRSEFSRVLSETPGKEEFLTTFLARAYEFKEISDYGKGKRSVTVADARDAINAAVRFVDRVVAMLST
jgi:uncharacterized protein (UPF0332 family)